MIERRRQKILPLTESSHSGWGTLIIRNSRLFSRFENEYLCSCCSHSLFWANTKNFFPFLKLQNSFPVSSTPSQMQFHNLLLLRWSREGKISFRGFKTGALFLVLLGGLSFDLWLVNRIAKFRTSLLESLDQRLKVQFICQVWIFLIARALRALGHFKNKD